MNTNIESHLIEKRVFKPSKSFAKKARIGNIAQYRRMYRESIRHPEKFWGREAQGTFWQKRWKKVLQWKAPFAKWFAGGKLNVSENCLDRHLAGPHGGTKPQSFGKANRARNANAHLSATASRSLPFCKCAQAKPHSKRRSRHHLHADDPRSGHRHAGLRANRRGAFGRLRRFQRRSIRDRIADCGAIAVITADGGYRRGAIVPLKKNVDDALERGEDVRSRRVIVFRRAGNEIHIEEGRDVWWHRELEYVDANCPPVAVDSEHPLYILYTSGSTGKPKGILHTTGGYLVGIYSTTKYVFDLREEDIYWCTADIGWVTGHSYVVYGPLANGATTLMYEGAPNWPEPDRFWKIIEEYRVNILYTAPTAIRAFIRWGDEWLKKHDLSSLRLLGSVGEPINPEAWMWYHEKIGGGRCPIVDTWWQTETGAIMVTPLPGACRQNRAARRCHFSGRCGDCR